MIFFLFFFHHENSSIINIIDFLNSGTLGERPQNFIRDHEPHLRFTEYPKLEKLIRLKDELNKQRAHPPVHIQADLRKFDWSSLVGRVLRIGKSMIMYVPF